MVKKNIFMHDPEAFGVIIQARMSSERFPGKMLALISGRPLIEYVYGRCKQSKAEKVLVATSSDSSDDVLYEYCKKNNIPAMRGDLDNVVKRYDQAAGSHGLKYICRVCGDTPFVDTSLIDSLFGILAGKKLDYAAPDRQTCASGFYSETFTASALKKVLKTTKSSEDLEHVTKYMLDNKDKFAVELVNAELNPEFMSKVRFTVDYPEDIKVANEIASRLPDDYSFGSSDILKIVKSMG